MSLYSVHRRTMLGRKREYQDRKQSSAKKRWQDEIDEGSSDDKEVTAEDIRRWKEREERNGGGRATQGRDGDRRREKGRSRERGRHRERETERDREKEKEREREREKETEREKDRESEEEKGSDKDNVEVDTKSDKSGQDEGPAKKQKRFAWMDSDEEGDEDADDDEDQAGRDKGKDEESAKDQSALSAAPSTVVPDASSLQIQPSIRPPLSLQSLSQQAMPASVPATTDQMQQALAWCAQAAPTMQPAATAEQQPEASDSRLQVQQQLQKAASAAGIAPPTNGIVSFAHQPHIAQQMMLAQQWQQQQQQIEQQRELAATSWNQASESTIPTVSPFSRNEEIFLGRIKRFVDMSAGGGYGFIDCEETKMRFTRDVYIHRNQMNNLSIGDQVAFSIVRNQKGEPQARNVMRAEDAIALRATAAPTPAVVPAGPGSVVPAPVAAVMAVAPPSSGAGLMDEEQAKQFQASLRQKKGGACECGRVVCACAKVRRW